MFNFDHLHFSLVQWEASELKNVTNLSEEEIF